MDRLARAFEERGYRWAYRIVNSLGFLPQRREFRRRPDGLVHLHGSLVLDGRDPVPVGILVRTEDTAYRGSVRDPLRGALHDLAAGPEAALHGDGVTAKLRVRYRNVGGKPMKNEESHQTKTVISLGNFCYDEPFA